MSATIAATPLQLSLTASPVRFCQLLMLALSMKGMRSFYSRSCSYNNGDAACRAYNAVILRLESELEKFPDSPTMCDTHRALVQVYTGLKFSHIGTAEQFRHHLRNATVGIADGFTRHGEIELPAPTYARAAFEHVISDEPTRQFMRELAEAFYAAYYGVSLQPI